MPPPSPAQQSLCQSEEQTLMKCHRCDSLMIYQDFYSADEHFRGWRCIGCGEIVDGVILENRRWAEAVRQSGRKREDVIRENTEAGD